MAAPPEDDGYVDMQSMAFRLPMPPYESDLSTSSVSTPRELIPEEVVWSLPSLYESDLSTSSVSTPRELIPEEVVWSLPSLYEADVSTSIVPSYPRDTSQAPQAASLALVGPQEFTITIPNSELMRFKFAIIVGVAFATISLLLNLWILIFVTKIKCA